MIRSSTPVSFENQIVVACQTIFISATPYPNAPDSFDWTQKYIMESLRELLAPKTVNKIGFAANICWTVLGVVLSSVFLDMENNEPRFHSDAKDDQELIQGKGYKQFEKRYNELSIPVYAFVIWNFFII